MNRRAFLKGLLGLAVTGPLAILAARAPEGLWCEIGGRPVYLVPEDELTAARRQRLLRGTWDVTWTVRHRGVTWTHQPR